MYRFFVPGRVAGYMRVTNTIRIHAICKDPQEREAIHQQLEQVLGKELSVSYEDIQDDERVKKTYDPLYALTARLYNQPEQKAFIKYLRKHLPAADKQALKQEAANHLDERLNFFFRLDKQAFLNNKCRHVLRGDVLQVRVNLCAHPKKSSRVLLKISELLA